MRIAITNWSTRKVGGAETYLNVVIPELARRGHEVAFWSEVDLPADRTKISLPAVCPVWCVAATGADRALKQLRAWKPDVVYGHGLADPALEARTIEMAPAILFAHNYHGTCISGEKTFKLPLSRPCSRRFGWQCLLQYYPRRCGGLSPITMVRQFRLQSDRLRMIRRYDRVVVASDHMRCEYLRNGLAPGLVQTIPIPIDLDDARHEESENGQPEHGTLVDAPCCTSSHMNESDGALLANRGAWRLLFAGRMVSLKGGLELIGALPLVFAKLKRPIRLTLAGDGPARAAWEQRARKVLAQCPLLSIDFTGWLDDAFLEALAAECDLLVMPSLWPEPFGRVGPEVGLQGVPAVGFAVGGIPEWLVQGVNGFLAPGDPPTAAGLAEAIVECLCEPDRYQRLRSGARAIATQFNMKRHLTRLQEILEAAADLGTPQRNAIL